MSKGRYAKKKSGAIPVWILAVILVALIAVIVFLMSRPENPDDYSASATGNQTADVQNQTGEALQTESGDAAGTDAAPSSGAQNDDPAGTASTSHDESKDPTVNPSDPQGQSQNPTAQTQPPAEEDNPPRATVMQQADADYEQWLAAAMVVCVSMEYPDFELEGIYATSVTELENKFDSDGVYIIFVSGGQRMAIFSKPLDGERKEAGTMDISTEIIGFASFDQVDPSSVNTAAMTSIKLDDLTQLINQSLLVSIYMR